jgi:hypothetical protein
MERKIKQLQSLHQQSPQAKALLKVGSNPIASCAPLFLQCYCLHVLLYTL